MASWAINGTPMDTEFVTVLVKPHSLGMSETMRRQDVGVLHDTMRSHLLGRNLPVWRFRLEFIGPSPQRYQQLLVIRNLIRGNATWTLEAPTDSQVVFEAGSKEIDLSMVNLKVDYGTGVDEVVLEVEALHVNPDLTSGLFDALIGCQALIETGFVINESVEIAQGTALLVTDPNLNRAESVEPVTGEEHAPTASEVFSRAEGLSVVNS